MPAPFFADSIEDKQVLLAQRSLEPVFALARAAELVVVGIGEVGPSSHLLHQRHDHAPRSTPRSSGPVRWARCSAASSTPPAGRSAAEINERAVAVRLEDLPGRQVVAIAGGRDKARAIAAVLESGLVTGLITDEATARELVGARRAGRLAARAASINRRPQGVLSMHDKERDLLRAFARGRLDRRELLRSAGRLGLGAAAASYLLNEAQTEALAADFDWQAVQGQDGQPAAQQASLHGCDDREPRQLQADDRDGREVRRLPRGRVLRQGRCGALLRQRPVRRLHDRRLPDLAVRPGRLDRRPQRVHLGRREDRTRTTTGTTCCRTCAPRPPGPACRSRRSAARAPSSGRSRGASSSTRSPTTGKYFDDLGIQLAEEPAGAGRAGQRRSPPRSKGYYGIGVRGSRSWATIHPGYLSAFANYGAADFEVADGKGKAAMNSAAGKEMTALWVKMIQEAGPEELGDLHLVPGRHRPRCGRLGDDLRRRHPGLLHERRRQQGEGQHRLRRLRRQPRGRGTDAQRLDLVAGDVRVRPTQQGRRLGVHAVGVAAPSTACSARARWTSSTRSAPSVWEDEAFRHRIAKSYPGYLDQFDASAPGSKIYFTPQPLFEAVTTAVGGHPAADGGQGGPGRRGPGPARGQHRRPAQAGRSRLSPAAGARSGARHSSRTGGGIMATTATWRLPPRSAASSAARPCPTSCRCRHCSSASAPPPLPAGLRLLILGRSARGLVLAAALQPEPADAARLHLVRAVLQLFQSAAFWNTVQVSLLYAFFTVGVELAPRPGHRAPAAPLDAGSTTRSRSRCCCR